MKHVWLLIFAVLATQYAYAQNKTFAIGTSTPNSNAALQVESPTNNQGILIPRLTTVQREAMSVGAADVGLIVYDITENAVFTWDGTAWFNGSVAESIALPYSETVTNGPANNNIFSIVENGTGAVNVGVARFEVLNPENGFSAIFAGTKGTNGAADLYIDNATNTNDVVGATTNGLGRAGFFGVNNTANNSTALLGQSNGSGRAVQGINTGTGAAGNFTINNATSTANAMFVQTNGLGTGLNLSLTEATNGSPALNINHSGTGNAITANKPIQATQFIGDGSQLTNLPAASGIAFPFADTVTTAVSPANDVFKLSYDNSTTARVVRIESLNASNAGSSLSVQQRGTGLAGYFQVANDVAGTSAIYATTNSNAGGELAPVGVYGESTGTGSLGGSFRNINTENTFPALFAETKGKGSTASFRVDNASNEATALFVSTNGLGSAATFQNVASSTNALINMSNAGTGDGIFLNSTSNSGSGTGLASHVNGTANSAGFFGIFDSGNSRDILELYTAGQGSSIRVNAANAANTSPAITITNAGTGNAITANKPIQATQFIGDGSLLTGVIGSKLAFPFRDSVTQALNAPVINIKYNNPQSTNLILLEYLVLLCQVKKIWVKITSNGLRSVSSPV